MSFTDKLKLGVIGAAVAGVVALIFLPPPDDGYPSVSPNATVTEKEAQMLACIKARILAPQRPVLPSTRRAGMPVMPLNRPAASAVFEAAGSTEPIKVVVAPQGSGKSTAARAFARDPQNAHVIYVNLANSPEYDAAAKAVARALGYRLRKTPAEEFARTFGYRGNDLDIVWGPQQYDELLRLFVGACRELRLEGKLTQPVQLVLDHVSQPLEVPFCFKPEATVAGRVGAVGSGWHRTLMPQTVATLAATGVKADVCRVVAVATAPLANHEAWTTPGTPGCTFSRLPPPTREEAETMVAHNIYGELHPEQDTFAHPPPEEVAAIKKTYASTIAFLVSALGPRPLWLNTVVVKRPLPPIPDAELAYAGKPLPDELKPYLPGDLLPTLTNLTAAVVPGATRDDVRVDAVSLAKFVGSIVTMRLLLGEVLHLQPDSTGKIKESDARRVVDADAGLGALLAAGSMPETDFERAFGASKELPRVLAARELIFYDLEQRQVEFDCDFLRRIVATALNSPIHKTNLEQARARLA